MYRVADSESKYVDLRQYCPRAWLLCISASFGSAVVLDNRGGLPELYLSLGDALTLPHRCEHLGG